MNLNPRSCLLTLLTLMLVVPFFTAASAGAAPALSTSVTLRSVGVKDGWIRESGEASNLGGLVNAAATTFRLGDDNADRQFRAILHFNTASIPDNATIVAVKLKIKRQSLVGTNPFTALGALRVDVRKPFFGAASALAAADFNAAATKNNAATFSATPVSGGKQYLATFPASSFQYVNKTGVTQFRLRFALDDNDDLGADYMQFFSGDYSVVSGRPELEIEYQP